MFDDMLSGKREEGKGKKERRFFFDYIIFRTTLVYYYNIIKTINSLSALFIRLQEGYLFGSILKFDVTCLFGLRHTVEIMIIYGIGATLSSTLLPLVIKRISIMTALSFTTVLHILTMILLFLSRSQNLINISPLIIKYIVFFSFGIVIGLWSTIAIYCLANATRFSSSATFAQSLAIRSIGRVLAYTCT